MPEDKGDRILFREEGEPELLEQTGAVLAISAYWALQLSHSDCRQQASFFVSDLGLFGTWIYEAYLGLDSTGICLITFLLFIVIVSPTSPQLVI